MIKMSKVYLVFLLFTLSVATPTVSRAEHEVDSLLKYADSTKNQGLFILSLEALEQALINSKLNHDSLNIYKINQHLGNLFYEWNDNDRSYYYYKEAQKIAISLGVDHLIAGAYNNLGTILSDQQRWDSSLIYYEKAHDIYVKRQDTLSIAGTNNNIGTIYHYKKDYANSIKYYHRAFKLMQDAGNEKDAAVFAINISASYKTLGNKDSALHYLNMAEELSKHLNIIRLDMRIANSYASLYEAFKNYESAMEYFNAYYLLKDSLYNIQKHEQIIEWQEKYESEKQKNIIALLQKQKEIDRVNLRKQNIIIYSVSFAALLVLVILFMIIHQNRLKTRVLKTEQTSLKDQKEKLMADKKLQETENQLLLDRIHHKERELVSSTMHVLQKNELIQKLKVELDHINKSLDNDSLNKFSREMKGLSSQSGIWESFSYHFEQVHPHFFTALKERFPQLTQNDLKISAYIKIGLNNKEIASLMQIAPDSVKSAKKRLKKKLSLSPEDDLSRFITMDIGE